VDGIFVIKGHFASGNSNSNLSRIVTINGDEFFDINSFMMHADVLLTDYSGCYFDFLCLNKPIILTPFDIEEYISLDRELYFNYSEIASGPIAKNWEDVYFHILDFEKKSDEYLDKRKRMNTYFNYYQDGGSSKRVRDSISKLINF
jgi:CDP-glycerol glycerophosphotransferase (TagB/SpsB family)